MYYFAYGSNMFLPRIRARVPSARLVARGALHGHQLRFHKIGRDGSAKCDAYFTGSQGDQVHGLLFEISMNERSNLDLAEGLGRGYEIKEAEIRLADGTRQDAFFYIATMIEQGLRPFTWYKDFVLYGAVSGRLPEDYVTERIRGIGAVADHDLHRAMKNMELLHQGIFMEPG